MEGGFATVDVLRMSKMSSSTLRSYHSLFFCCRKWEWNQVYSCYFLFIFYPLKKIVCGFGKHLSLSFHSRIIKTTCPLFSVMASS